MTAPAKAPAIPFPFLNELIRARLPLPTPEFRFHPERKWRFDYAWPPKMEPRDCGGALIPTSPPIALEVQGGLFVNGRHSRGAALLKEHEKLSEAAVLGWRILYCTPDKLCSPVTIDLIKRALEA